MIQSQPLDIWTEGLYSSYNLDCSMEQQKQILDFQIPFELGGRNSNRVSAVPSLIQGAELFRRLFFEGLTLREIARKHNTNYKAVQKLIGDDYYKLKKKCKYCDEMFYKRDCSNIFHKKLICNSTKCRKKYHQENNIKKGNEYFRLKERERILKNPNYKKHRKIYQRGWREKNPNYHKTPELKLKKKEWNSLHNPISMEKRRKRENQRRLRLGLPLIGENYKKENEILEYIKELFPQQEILHRKRIIPIDKDKRKNLELDIYIPQLRLAFEYNGEQHYSNKNYRNLLKYYAKVNPNRVSRSFEDLQYNDRIKKKICKLIGIKLVIIKYNEKLSEELIREKCQIVGCEI